MVQQIDIMFDSDDKYHKHLRQNIPFHLIVPIVIIFIFGVLTQFIHKKEPIHLLRFVTTCFKWNTSNFEKEENQEFKFIHIHKAAGSSFKAQLNNRYKADLRYCEMCFHEIFDEDAFNLIMLRNPLSHVLSQFQECKYDPFFVKETRNTDFPQNASDEKGFKKWVSFFNDNWEIEEGDFNCYNPWVINSTTFFIIRY